MKKISLDDLVFNSEWQYDNPETGVSCSNGIIKGTLFFSALKGRFSSADVEAYAPILKSIFSEGGYYICTES